MNSCILIPTYYTVKISTGIKILFRSINDILQRGNELINRVQISRSGTFFALVGLVVTSLLYMVGYFSYSYYHESTNLAKDLKNIAKSIDHTTEQYFQKYRIVLQTLSETITVRKRDQVACNQLFKEMNNLSPSVINYAAANKNGSFFGSGKAIEQGLPKAKELFFFKELAQGKREYIMNPHKGPITGEMVTGIALSIYSPSGEFDGVIGVSTKFEELKRMWGNLLKGYNDVAIIIEMDGKILSTSNDFIRFIGKPISQIDPKGYLWGKHPPDKITLLSKKYIHHRINSKTSKWQIIVLTPTHYSFFSYLKNNPKIIPLGLPLVLLFIITFILFYRDRKAFKAIVTKEKQLKKHRGQLEKIVGLRTSELTQTNQQLTKEIQKHKETQKEREKLIFDLQEAFDSIKILKGLLPICSNCKRIRDDKGYWNQIESYISNHSEVEFSHGICKECADSLYPDLDLDKE